MGIMSSVCISFRSLESARYVLICLAEKALGFLKGADYQMLVDQITPLLSHMKKFNYGKQIAAIERHLSKETSVTAPSTASLSDNSTAPPSTNDLDSSTCGDDNSLTPASSTRGTPMSSGVTLPATTTTEDSVGPKSHPSPKKQTS